MSVDHRSCSDAELVGLALARSEPAFAEIMHRYRETIFRLIRGHVGDPNEALDLVQETFVSAHRAMGRYDPARPLRVWLSAIAINKCRDWGRKRLVRRFLSFASAADVIAENVADDQPPIDIVTADRQELIRVARAIARLPRALKEPLILRAIEGLGQAETAGILSISEKAVETRLYRARARLREMLKQG